MNFPLVTWQVTAPAFTVTNAIGTASVAASTGYYGFGVASLTAPYFASAGSVAGHLEAEITAATVGSPPVSLGITATAVYNITDTTGPSLSPLTMTLSTTSASAITLVFASLADAAVYGFASTTVSINSSSSPLATTTTFNVGGVWAPSGVSGDVTRTTKQRAASSSSEMSGLSTDVVNWGEVVDIEVRSTLFPVANAFTWYASQSIYATKAGRLIDDPNNIFEKMLAAAATGVTFRVYEQVATLAGTTVTRYQPAKMPGISSKSAATDFLQADDAPRLWSASGIFLRGTT